METAADRLVRARTLAGYASASDAARAMGVSLPTYMAHENGSRSFMRAATRYAGFFRVQLAWLMTGKGAARGDELAVMIENLPPHKREQAIDYVRYLNDRD